MVSLLLLLCLGIVAGTLFYLGLVVFPQRAAPIEALRALAAAHNFVRQGDGLASPLSVIGTIQGRPFTITYQHELGTRGVLMVGVDCQTTQEGALPGTAVVANAAALTTRWVHPPMELLTPERLYRLLIELDTLAHELEAQHPAGPETDD